MEPSGITYKLYPWLNLSLNRFENTLLKICDLGKVPLILPSDTISIHYLLLINLMKTQLIKTHLLICASLNKY